MGEGGEGGHLGQRDGWVGGGHLGQSDDWVEVGTSAREMDRWGGHLGQRDG